MKDSMDNDKDGIRLLLGIHINCQTIFLLAAGAMSVTGCMILIFNIISITTQAANRTRT